MNLAELQAEVYTLTNRPDRVAETLSAVRAATLKAHNSDYYYRDLYETAVVFSSSEFFQQVDYQSLVPRWRAFKYLRKLDTTVTPNVPGKFFDLVVPENVLDDYAVHREDICYVAGQNLQVRSSTAFQYALMGCYIHPDITVATYSSWIAVDNPWAIIYEAASAVFKMIGKSEEGVSYKLLAGEQYAELKISNIVANGY
jgi:hypothetical protein